MKTDNYMTHCLEQAAKSPLHYRHGAIVVRGGKIIGQGYNDHRSKYDGGALKNGRIAGSALDGAAMAELKEKLKKQKKSSPQPQPQQSPSKSFTPFEGTGGGPSANGPLSMHSEMMALNSALGASSTMASSTFSQEKPCFKLPGGHGKRKSRLRREALEQFKSAVLKLPHLDAVRRTKDSGNNRHEYEGNNNEEYKAGNNNRRLEKKALAGPLHRGRGFQASLGGGKHHSHQNRKQKQNGTQNESVGHKYQSQYSYGLSGQQQVSQQRQQRSLSESRTKCEPRKDAELTSYDNGNDHDNGMKDVPKAAAPSQGKPQKDYKRSGKMKARSPEPPRPEPMLLPTGQASHSLSDRKKHPRLNGADLYVCRLGWPKGNTGDTTSKKKSQGASGTLPTQPTVNEQNENAIAGSSSSNTISPARSLHDELTCTATAPAESSQPAGKSTGDVSHGVRASRPCYRCIAYMHSVGIKRVFWTTDEGTWEGGKVRDLVDALERSYEGSKQGEDGKENGILGNGVFVTKHEVLMLKRMMGDG